MKLRKVIMAAAGVVLAGTLVFSGCDSKKNNDGSSTGTQSTDDGTKSAVTLGAYEGIEVTVEALPDITEGDVIDTVMAAVENATVTQEITDRAVAEGDTVNVSYTGYMENEEIPDSAVEDYNILIGSGVFFNGAESGLIGVMPGETVDISVTFPDGYPQEDLVGKSAVYKVTVNYIASEQQAELTDEFVASISDCSTVEEYQQQVREALEESRENEREMNRRNAVWSVVLDNARVTEYGTSDVAKIADEYKSYDASAAEDFGMSLEDYVQTYQGMSIDEYNETIDAMAKQQIKEQLVIDAIAEEQGIDGEDMTEEEIDRCARELNYDSVDDYKNSRDPEDMKEDVKAVRVMDFIMDSAVITETPAQETTDTPAELETGTPAEETTGMPVESETETPAK